MARRGGPGPDQIERLLAEGAARTLRVLSRLRRKRVFHPYGVGFSAHLTPLGQPSGAEALDREADGLARLSRALGLPEWLPDPCGLAIRIPDAHGPGRHQDLLLVSSAMAIGGRHAVLPARDFFDRPYSSLLPYELNGNLVMLGASALDFGEPGPRLEDLRRREEADISFELAVASPGGDWEPAATLALGRRLPAEQTERLGFDPTNTGGGLQLAGALNRIRGPSYRASQAGRAEAYGGPSPAETIESAGSGRSQAPRP